MTKQTSDRTADLEFRNFQPADFSVYQSWFSDGWLSRFLGPMRTDDEWLDAVLNPEPDDLTISALTMAPTSELVAVLNLHVGDSQPGSCVISSFAVDPAKRRAGLGRKIITYLAGQYPELVALVDQNNCMVIRFFADNGFRHSGRDNEMLTMIRQRVA